MFKIIVSSNNPVKINATLSGFQQMFPEEVFEIEGVTVDTGVSNQPLSDKETFTGASNRIKAIKDLKPQADF
jgi:non-canonical (house-cleaning) NTP pyrophosphatase